jgi:serine/threonine protein phosphatase PrpC
MANKNKTLQTDEIDQALSKLDPVEHVPESGPQAKNSLLREKYPIGQRVWIFDRGSHEMMEGEVSSLHPETGQVLVSPIEGMDYQLENRWYSEGQLDEWNGNEAKKEAAAGIRGGFKEVLTPPRPRQKIETIEDFKNYLKKPGIDVSIPRSDKSVSKGKLIRFDNENNYVVIFKNNDETFGKKTFKAERLYALNPELKEKVKAIRQGRIAADSLTSLSEELAPIETPTVLDGNRYETLEDSIKSFRFSDGIEGAAATYPAGYLYNNKKHNEDRVAIHPQAQRAVVVDGMGGQGNGDTAADITGRNLIESPDNPGQALKAASIDMDLQLSNKQAGAVFLSAKVKLGQPIAIAQAGDVELWHFDRTGQVKHQPSNMLDKGLDPQSAMDSLEQDHREGKSKESILLKIRHMGGLMKTKNPEKEKNAEEIAERVVKGERPYVKPGEALFNRLRSIVVGGIMSNNTDHLDYLTDSVVEKGDWVILMSDGISDMFEPEEIRHVIRNSNSPEVATRHLSKELKRRIEHYVKNGRQDVLVYRDKKRAFKLDNASVVIMRAPDGEAKPKAA